MERRQTNLSIQPVVLLLVLWYCYKRGREERILREEAEAGAESSSRRYEELSDDEDEAGQGDKRVTGSTEAAEAAEVIPVIITSPEGEVLATEIPKDAATPDVEAPSPDAPAEKTHS